MLVTRKNAEKDSDEIDLGRLVGELIDHRKLIISVTALFTLFSLAYALFATPIYQADAMIQVEERQANSILSNLSQMLPDSQPQSAPEIALIQSRMILGKTVDDLNLQTRVVQSHFPLFGAGWSRIMGDKQHTLSVSRFYIKNSGDYDSDIVKAKVKVIDSTHYLLLSNGFELNGTVGELINEHGIAIKIDEINAPAGTSFDIYLVPRLKAITDLQKMLSVSDQGKNTGMLTLTVTGDDPSLIEKILDSISGNYLAQNIARQAAKDQKRLEFLYQQLPKVRAE